MSSEQEDASPDSVFALCSRRLDDLGAFAAEVHWVGRTSVQGSVESILD